MEDGPPRFPPGFTCPAVLGNILRRSIRFRLQGCHPLWPTFPDRSANVRFCNSLAAQGTARVVPRHRASNAPRLTLTRFRLFPVRSPLLGESLLMSFPPGTEMFQFPGLATSSLCIQLEADRSSLPGFPIRRSSDLCLLAAPRGFSQLSTSFIASRRLGIHHAPLVA